MKTIIHKADSRGFFDHGWLKAKHSFSFGRWYDPERVNFGALRVLNDDIIQPSTGFGMHPHDNMEIISVILEGAIQHEDSMGHKQVIRENEVQVMSAGTGIFHSEHNASKTSPLNLLQIWIFPKEKNIKPVYNQHLFGKEEAQNKWQRLVSNGSDGGLEINQDAFISRAFVDAGKEVLYTPGKSSFGTYLFVVEGYVIAGEDELFSRDAVGLVGADKFSVKAKSDAYVLAIEVPDINLK